MKIAPENLMKHDSNTVGHVGNIKNQVIRISGVIITILYIAMFQQKPSLGVEFPAVFAFFDILIIYSIYIGGTIYGTISLLMVLVYTIYFYIYYLMSSIGLMYTAVNAAIVDINFLAIAVFAETIKCKLIKSYNLFRESQLILSMAEESESSITCHLGLNGEILDTNSTLCSILGYNKSEILNLNISDIIHFNDLNSQIESMENLIEEKVNSVDLEKRLLAKDEEIVWMSINMSLIRDDEGNPSYYLVHMKDISQGKKAMIELYESKKILRAILNSTDDGILVVNNLGHISHYNQLFLRMWGIGAKEEPELMHNNMKLQKYTAKKVINSEEFERRMEHLLNVPVEAIDTIYLLDGRIVERYSQPLMKENVMIGRVWSFRDITRNKLAEKKLKESEEMYRQFVELLPAGIFLYKEGRIVFTNTAMVNLLGAESTFDLIGRDFMEFVHPDFRRMVNKKITDIKITQGNLQLVENKFLRFDGETISLDVTGTILNYEGKPSYLIAAQDASERQMVKKMEREVKESKKLVDDTLTYDKLRTEFIANISHELRTPLNVVFGALQLLEMYTKNNLIVDNGNNLKKYTKMMKQNCYRILRLVNNLIDITKIESGYLFLELKNYDIVNLVENITLSVVEYANNKNINLIFDTDVEEKVMACDPDKMERIILNLLANAVKFTEPGGEIMVKLHDEGDSIIISIKDNGIGIPEDKLEIIFERFRQVNKSLTRDHQGSGIGLALVKSLVEMHGGTIIAKSKLGKGSEFIVSLPVEILPDQKEEEISSHNRNNYVETINIEFSDIYS